MGEFVQVPVLPIMVPLTREAVQMAWDVFVKPMQSDDARPQSIEDRILMACLRTVYANLPEE